jgi:putative membrane protein
MKSRILVALTVAICSIGASAYAEQGPARRANASKGQPAMKAMKLNDGEILGVADTANGGEVDQGKVAASKAQSPAVKAFANRMIADHSAAKQKVEETAKEIGVAESTSDLDKELKTSGQALLTELKNTNAANFDRVYMQAQLDLHKKVLKTINEELMPQTSSPKVKAVLADMRTHVQHHLALAQQTLKDLGVKNAD